MEANNQFSKEEIRQELLKRNIRNNLWSFLLYMNYSFWYESKESIKEIADTITVFYFEGNKRIAISAPPRFRKSTFANYTIAWLLLQDENTAIIRASYSQNLSTELNQSVRDLIRMDKYKDLLTFPLEEVENTKQKLRFKNRHRASLYASSVGGSTTGFGGNVLISDDLYKDHLEALSDTTNQKTIDWYQSAFASRQDGNNQLEIMIGTRWRTNELVDILDKSEHFDKVFKIRALDENNKSFNEKIITTETLLARKKIMHPAIFESMYQQNPIEAFDSVIKQEELIFAGNYKPTNYSHRIMLFDIADRGTDRTAGVVADVYKDKVIIVDLFTDEDQLEITRERILKWVDQYEPTNFLIEENNNSYFARELVRDISYKLPQISGSVFRTTQNKLSKILLNSPKIKMMTFLEDDDKEYNEFVRRMCKFDLAIKNQHDDEIDCLAMLADFITKLGVLNYDI